MRLLQEGLIPTLRLVIPGSHEDSALHHDDPNADEAVGLSAGPEAEYLTRAERSQDLVRELSFGFHEWLARSRNGSTVVPHRLGRLVGWFCYSSSM